MIYTVARMCQAVTVRPDNNSRGLNFAVFAESLQRVKFNFLHAHLPEVQRYESSRFVPGRDCYVGGRVLPVNCLYLELHPNLFKHK